MKQLLLTLCAVCALCGSASARRLQFGVRGGVNTTDFRFAPVQIGDNRFSTSASRMGYEAGLVLRFNLTKIFHLQSEFNYDIVNYRLRCHSSEAHTFILMRSERLELPVQLGLQFGPMRLFGGVAFRLNSSLNSSHPDLLQVRFDGDRMAWMGGLGVHFRRFFADFRIQGYPGKHTTTFLSEGVSQQVRMRNDIVWGGSVGFFF